jgi:hypothetical protein
MAVLSFECRGLYSTSKIGLGQDPSTYWGDEYSQELFQRSWETVGSFLGVKMLPAWAEKDKMGYVL